MRKLRIDIIGAAKSGKTTISLLIEQALQSAGFKARINDELDPISHTMRAENARRVENIRERVEIDIFNQKQVPIFIYIYQQIKALEVKTGCVIVLQFATHPSGNLATIFRAHNPKTKVESPPISDIIMLSEIENNADVIPRLEVLFTEIHKALNSIQTVNPKMMVEVIGHG